MYTIFAIFHLLKNLHISSQVHIRLFSPPFPSSCASFMVEWVISKRVLFRLYWAREQLVADMRRATSILDVRLQGWAVSTSSDGAYSALVFYEVFKYDSSIKPITTHCYARPIMHTCRPGLSGWFQRGLIVLKSFRKPFVLMTYLPYDMNASTPKYGVKKIEPTLHS